ncbi:aa3-type cytochrome c oxidase subunit IV [Palleronia abyssalis]|uniref:Cytochrome c oxidase subunit IV bacterial aa3 type domain-containing protein n=1 Tax=Palleronia abyssalis TaxID=1501240 RepID=A0A2R8BTL6_9RHOB|nr:aa3-type cytochrome c oxidase subunit IV [Palleronia abyssalis]SPJ23517.1 hypothetical protein PAA8504_01329 [Palleronia abyssalis]
MVYQTGAANLAERNMAKHSHGSMNIETQEKTFDAFIKWVTRTTIVIIVALILLGLVNG